MAIGFNSSKAFGGGNWRKRLKWQRQTNWWSNSATYRCWRLLDWSSSLKKSGASVPLRQWRLRQDPRQEVLRERQLQLRRERRRLTLFPRRWAPTKSPGSKRSPALARD